MKPLQFIDRRTGEKKTERPPGEGFLKFLYYRPLGGLTLNALVKRKFLSRMYGGLMKKPRSRRRIQKFIDQYGIDTSDFAKQVKDFTSFNDFFIRELKPGVRPIGDGFVAPADGKALAFERVSDVGEFYVKGNLFTLTEFLQDESVAARFQHHSMFIVRLAPDDYHRWHFPYSGHITAAQEIKGALLSVSPYATLQNFGRVFMENKREYAILDTDDIGQVLIAAVGATMVGSIVQTYPPDSRVNKGEEMGYFQFGGSSLLLLVDRRRVELDDDLLANTRAGLETAVVMGERIGRVVEGFRG